MDKQELIQKVKDRSEYPGKYPCAIIRTPYVLEMINELDEPQKVKVPEFVAAWYEMNKKNLEYRIWKYIKNWDDQRWNDFKNWMDKNSVKSLEILTRMQYGYEVEEEQRWAVKLKFGRQYLSENADGTAIDFYSFMFPVRSYTKKELEAVEDGAFYKIDGDKEWINPIIELIPAEKV